MPDDQFRVYYELLNDIPENALRCAVVRALAESDQNFIPAVGMLRRLASEALHGTLPSWGVEWERVNMAIRQFGRDRGKDAAAFLGPFTAAIVRQVGWRSICDSETIGVQMSLFRSLYESTAHTEMTTRRISEELRPIVSSAKLLTVTEQKRLAVSQ